MQISLENKVVDLFRPEHISSDVPLVLLLAGGEDSDVV